MIGVEAFIGNKDAERGGQESTGPAAGYRFDQAPASNGEELNRGHPAAKPADLPAATGAYR
jgi:hypothetical protein